MSIEQDRDDQHDGRFDARTPAAAHAHDALVQAAHYAAALAIARWAAPALPGAPLATPARAGWYARAQADLQSWFDAGGFARDPWPGTPDDLGRGNRAGTGAWADADALPFPGSRPRFYNLFRVVRSTAD